MATLSDLSFPRNWGRVASGGLVAATYIPRPGQGERTAFRSKTRSDCWQRCQPNGTYFGCFAALSCLQYGPAKAGFRLKAGTTNFRTGVCSTEL